MKLALLITAMVALLALVGTGVAQAAETYYAAPKGTGTTCSEATPCSLGEAYGRAAEGDSVLLEPGTYTLGESLAIGKSITIGGEVGGAATTVVRTTTFDDVFTQLGDRPTIHDLTLEGSGSFVLNAGVAERMLIAYTGVNTGACSIYGGPTPTVLRDSVCWAHGGGSVAAVLASLASGSGGVVLANDTAVSSVAAGAALDATASGGAHLNVQVTNSVLEGDLDDIEALDGGSGSTTAVSLTHSNYDTVQAEGTGASVTAPGTAGNQTAQPRFLSVAEADFREAPTSPTIDAGIADPAAGEFALGGEARELGSCIGTAGVPDIGAYEVVPPVCPAVATLPTGGGTTPAGSAAPVPAPSIRVVKVLRKQLKGSAVLLVAVSGPGRLTLSGKGVKPLARPAPGSGVVRLPVWARGKARLRLNRAGRARIGLALHFAASPGGACGLTRKLTLRRTGGANHVR